MAQIIPRTPDIYDTLAGLLGKTGEGFGKGIQASMKDFFEEKKNQRKATRVEDLLKGISDEELDPTHKKLIMSRARGDITSDALTLLMKQNQQGLEHSKNKRTLLAGIPKAIKDLAGDEWTNQSTEDKAGYQKLAGDIFDRTGDANAAQQGAIDQFLKDQRGEDEDLGGPGGGEGAPEGFSISDLLSGLGGIAGGPIAGALFGKEEPSGEFTKGIRRGGRESAIGAALGAQPTEEELVSRAQESPSRVREMGEVMGSIIGDLPTLAAGSALGGPPGALLLTGMVKRGADEIYGAMRSKDKFTMEKGGEAAYRLAHGASKDLLLGKLFQWIPGFKKVLAKNPWAKKFLESTAGSAITDAAATTAVLGTAEPILEARVPKAGDYTNAFKTVLAFEALRLPKILSKKIDTIGQKSGATPEEFSKDLRTEFKRVGGSEEALEKGEQRQITKLNEAAENLKEKAGRVEEKAEKTLAKRQPVAAEEPALEKKTAKEKALAEKVAEKPVEEFTKERPRTKEQKRRRDRLKTIQSDIRDAERKLNKIDRIKAEKPPESKKGKENLQLAEEATTRRLDGLKESLDTVREEIKGERKIQPEKAISEGIQKHLAELEEAAAKPGGATDKKYQQMFERDQKYIDQAQDLIKSGDLPSPRYIDAYTKILEKYDNAYKNMLKETQGALDSIEKPKTKEQRAGKKRLEKLKKDLLKNKDINNSKQLKQGQKNFIKEKFRGPGRTFFKKYLKDLQVQSKNLKKNFFEYNKELGETQTRVDRIGRENVQKEIQTLAKKPTDVNVKRFAEKLGLETTDAREALDVGKDISEKIADEVKKGTPWEKAKEFIGMEKSYFTKKSIPQIKKAILGGVVGNVVQGSLEKFFDIKVPLTALTFFLPGFHKVRFGAAIMSNLMRQLYNKGMEAHWKDQYKNAQSVSEKTALVRKLKEKGWSSAKIAKLRAA
ncbi:MAG: hypothetical protein K940chlam3_00137 [Chlamydiae bacterium]|nr:hypothetical protein [Chlamydiota bacterium]